MWACLLALCPCTGKSRAGPGPCWFATGWPTSCPVSRHGSRNGSSYALFSGVAFLSSIGVLLAPFLHRFMHRFHLEDDDSAGG